MEEAFTIEVGKENYKVTPVQLNFDVLRFEICLHGEIWFWVEHYINRWGNQAWAMVNKGNLTDTSKISLEYIGYKIDSHFD